MFVGSESLAIYNLDGRFYATSDACTHGSGSLSEGWVCDHEVECPLHQGRFDVRTGKAVGAPCAVDVRTFPIRIDHSRVWVEIAGSDR